MWRAKVLVGKNVGKDSGSLRGDFDILYSILSLYFYYKLNIEDDG